MSGLADRAPRVGDSEVIDEDAAVPVLPVLRNRWSPRVWDERHVLDSADLQTLLEAARWAPSAGNSQPWAFIVGRRGDANHHLIRARLAGSARGWAPSASALVITAHQSAIEGTDMPYSDYAAYDLGQAVAHLTIQAQGMALHTRQFAAFDHDGIAEDFAVPAHWTITTAIAIGKAAGAEDGDDPRADTARTRRNRSSLVITNWPDPGGPAR